jgi:seryl-tRNA synthetase
MAKGRDKAARDKLAKARKRLDEAEGKLAEAQTDAEERIRTAHEKVDKRLAAARKKVEKAERAFADIEARVLRKTAPRTPSGEVSSATVAAEVITEIEAASEVDSAPVPGSTAEVPLLEPYQQPAGEISTSTDVQTAAQENSQGW